MQLNFFLPKFSKIVKMHFEKDQTVNKRNSTNKIPNVITNLQDYIKSIRIHKQFIHKQFIHKQLQGPAALNSALSTESHQCSILNITRALLCGDSLSILRIPDSQVVLLSIHLFPFQHRKRLCFRLTDCNLQHHPRLHGLPTKTKTELEISFPGIKLRVSKKWREKHI